MADALNDVQKRFDKLVKDIIRNINRIINKLKKEKEKTIQIYRDEVHGYHLSRMEAVDNRKAEFDTLMEARQAQIPADKRGEVDGLVAQIQTLRRELEELMEREMQIESGVALKIKDEPARIEKEIGLMNSLLEYIKSHVKVGKLFSRGRLISPLNTKAIYQRIKDVYDEVKSRETEGKIVDYYLKMKKEIEQKSEEILSGIKRLMAILGKEEEAVSPKAVEEKKKAVEKAEKVLKREENYFMLFNEVLKQLRNVAASNLPPKQKLKEAQALLKRLKRYESREQWRASASNLEGKLNRLLKIPSISQEKKQEIEKDVRELKIFEGDLLVKTVRRLGRITKKRVQAEQVNWQEFIGILNQIEKDIQAAIAVDERLDKLLESEKKGIRGRVGAGLGAAGRLVGGAAGFAGRGIGRVATSIPTTGLDAARAIGGKVVGAGAAVIHHLPNPVPSLKNWASNVSGTAKRLRDKIRRKGDTTPEQGEAAAAEVSGPEVDTRVNILLQVAQGIRNFNPGKSAKLTGLANKIRELKDRIFANLKRLRKPGITTEEADEIAAEVDADAVAAEATAEEAEAELSKLGQLREWLKSRMPDIDLKGAAGAVRGRVVGAGVAVAGVAKVLGDKILEAVKAAYSGVAGAARNVWGALGNWWSSLSGAAGNLASGAKTKADLSGLIDAVKSFGGNSLKAANTGVGFLIGNAQKVLKMPHVDIKAKERIRALAGELSKLQTAIGDAIGRLRPGLPREQIKGIADFIVANSKRAAEIAKALGGELGKVPAAVGGAAAAVAAKVGGDQILEAVKAAYSGVAGAARNVWGALGNWWSSLSGAAGNLANAAKTKADLSGLIDAVKSFGGNSLKAANTGVGFLIGNAQKVLKMPHVDIKAKERIRALAGELSKLQTAIGDAIGRLRPGLPREQIKGIADFIVANSKRAAEIAKALWEELGKVGGVAVRGVGRGARLAGGGVVRGAKGAGGAVAGAARGAGGLARKVIRRK